jgi:acyl-CoA synthetase (AMP-forming)/AMP-acid ligase II
MLPSLRRVLCAGAPVPAALWTDSQAFLPNGRLHSPYGATEALPVATVDAQEIAALAQPPSGLSGTDPTFLPGAPIGRPLGGISVRIIPVSDQPIPLLDNAREIGPGEIGEIIVSGPVVTKEYDALPEATALAKISAKGCLWHRMGDCGYLDAKGFLWFCGRKAERVETSAGTLYTEPCERVFRRHPRAARCALIGLGPPGRQQPAIVVEAKIGNSAEARALAGELRELALKHPQTEAIGRFFFHPQFPLDVRHNAKIHRLTLARWAAAAGGARHGVVSG